MSQNISLSRLTHETFQNALLAINKSKSIPDIESNLQNSLFNNLGVEQVRVLFPPNVENFQANILKSGHFSFESIPLNYPEQNFATVFYLRRKKLPFKKTEVALLQRISESLTLSLKRVDKLEKLEILKTQWDLTFNSISDPICVVDNKFYVQRANRSFEKSFLSINEKAPDVELFIAVPELSKVNFGKREHLQSVPIQVQGVDHYFDITFHDLNDSLILIFNEITEERKLEEQIVKSSRLAELGIISSSIAHELNNPIGGMLSYAQLIKMGLAKEDPIFEDVSKIENSIIKCKNIVEDMLGFARQTPAGENEHCRLDEVLAMAIKLVKLQTRFLYINFDLPSSLSLALIKGNPNNLVQALNNVLQFTVENVRRTQGPGPENRSTIYIDSFSKDNKEFLEIRVNSERDNFTTQATALGLKAAKQILEESGGNLEISSQPNIGLSAKIAFQRLDLNC